MAISFTKEDIERIEKAGGRVSKSMKPRPKKAETMPAEKAKGIDVDVLQKVSAMNADNMLKVANLITEGMRKLERKPMPYKFTINRDKNGQMTSVDAEPVG